MTQTARAIRSALFTPATRPDQVAKLPATGADLGVVDLEDAVAPNTKAQARILAVEACRRLAAAAPGFAVAVRVNPVSTDDFSLDIDAGVADSASSVLVPKVEQRADLEVARAALDGRGLGDVAIVAGIESARGVLECPSILAGGLATAVYFGAEDFVADMGGERTPVGHEVLYARSHVALVARVHGVVALDQIVAAHTDDEQFQRDAAVGRSIGFAGKLCIHPRQVTLAHRAFRPAPEAVERAHRLVAEYEAALAAGVGVITFDGQMVDQPMLRHARSLVAAAESDRPAAHRDTNQDANQEQ